MWYILFILFRQTGDRVSRILGPFNWCDKCDAYGKKNMSLKNCKGTMLIKKKLPKRSDEKVNSRSLFLPNRLTAAVEYTNNP